MKRAALVFSMLYMMHETCFIKQYKKDKRGGIYKIYKSTFGMMWLLCSNRTVGLREGGNKRRAF